MTRLPKEEDIILANNITLTNQRIWSEEKDWGSNSTTVFFLEDVSSVESRYTSNVIVLVVAALGILAAIFGPNSNIQTIGGCLTAFCILVYFLTRRHVIKVTSHSSVSLSAEVRNMSKDEIETLIYDIQLAKAGRIKTL
jgi:hypothetical protein